MLGGSITVNVFFHREEQLRDEHPRETVVMWSLLVGICFHFSLPPPPHLFCLFFHVSFSRAYFAQGYDEYIIASISLYLDIIK